MESLLKRCTLIIVKISLNLLLVISSLLLLGQTNPDDYSGLELWLKSDTGLTLTGNNRVIQWDDQSGNENHAGQEFDNLRPVHVTDVLNGYPSVRMDGNNDLLEFPEINNIQTVFWIIRQDDDATYNNRPLLSHSTTFDFHAGNNGEIWHSTQTNDFIKEGITKVNYQVIDGTQTVYPTGFILVSLRCTGPVEANRFSRDRNNWSSVWDGELVELIVYSQAMDSVEVGQIENYLANRYTPEFSVSEDVLIEYGFCDTTLCASEGMNSYLWSTGENTSCITVNSSGNYSILAADDFGRIHEDTVVVQFPGNLNPGQASICIGDEYAWDLELEPELYAIEWQDGSSDVVYTTTIEMDLSVTIVDDDGCSFSSPPLHVSVDNLSEIFSLGEDIEFCGGSSITPIDNEYNIVDYLWSNDSTSSSIAPVQSGQYWLEVIDSNDCFAVDTIDVVVLGENPIPQFTINNQCEGETSQFNGSITNGVEIESWLWDFGDEQSSNAQNPNHEFSVAGDYFLTLTAISTEGCEGQLQEQVSIHPIPILAFSTDQLCAETSISFLDESFVQPGGIANVLWEINGINLSGSLVSSYFSNSGIFSISHSVISSQGCIASEDVMIEILSQPDMDIDYEGVCLGELTHFSAELQNPEDGSIENWLWDFGDENSSGLINPNHIFSETGTQNIELTNLFSNGCIGISNINVYIREQPEVSMSEDIACLNQSYLLDNTSISNGGGFPVVEWNIDGIGDFSGDNAEVIFTEVNSYFVTLNVETSLGCTGSTIGSIFCAENPEPSMYFNPLIGLPPLDVNFQSTGDSNDLSTWIIDNEEISGNSINYTFSDTGMFHIELISTNIYGCTTSLFDEIQIEQPLPDLFIEIVDYQETTEGLLISARVKNMSNFTVRNMNLSWSIDNGISVTESWMGEFAIGATLIYNFNAIANTTIDKSSFVCVDAHTSDTGFEDITPRNNTLCQEIGNSTEVSLLTVYPNPVIDILSLEFILPAIGEYTLMVSDNIGREVNHFEGIQGQKGYNRVQLNLNHLRQGNYLLSLEFEGKPYVISFVKQ